LVFDSASDKLGGLDHKNSSFSRPSQVIKEESDESIGILDDEVLDTKQDEEGKLSSLSPSD
jgi:hypothetical protein